MAKDGRERTECAHLHEAPAQHQRHRWRNLAAAASSQVVTATDDDHDD